MSGNDFTLFFAEYLQWFYAVGLSLSKLIFLPVAPIKALCSQCFESWNKKFSPLGLTCKELTGDTEVDDLLEIQDSHIILTTPVGGTSRGSSIQVNMRGWVSECGQTVWLFFFSFAGKMGQHDKKMEGQLSAAACQAVSH